MKFKALYYGLLGWTAVSLAQQVQLADIEFAQRSYDHGLFTPLEDLSGLSETTFTTLRHPIFPKYSVRIKKSSFCHESVKSYTGYIDIEARHIFFYFFESRDDPDKDDMIFWTNGGPGCSSSLGLLMELGPCRLTDANTTKFHPESWTSHANVFFVDQPVGVGFSYAEFGESVSNTQDAAKDIAAFITIFFEHFSKFKGRALHMASESYGGRYIPVFASEVYDQNAQLAKFGLTPVNLTSIIIGNGFTDFHTMIASYYDLTCTSVSVAPIYDIQTCVRMKQLLPKCLQWTKISCVDRFEPDDCQLAASFCWDNFVSPFHSTNKNPYDITRECEGKIEETFCYPVIKQISQYLSRDDVRSKLGVDLAVPSEFLSCSPFVENAFASQLDQLRPTYHYVAALLERGVKALIYVGKNDWICNFIGNEAWTLQLEWTKQREFANQPLREWIVNERRAGVTRSAGGLTFATVEGAGHMVPYDKPQVSLEMIRRWLSGKDL